MTRFGAELELIVVNENGIPITWEDWLELIPDFEKVLPQFKPNTDILTGAFLGYEIEGLGVIGLDSSASLFELAIEPADTIKDAVAKIKELATLVESAIKPGNFSILWVSQYPRLINFEEYLKRYTRRGLYAVIRRFWNWKHHELYLSASFQPAIDVSPDELAEKINAIYATSPVLISTLGGNSHLATHEYRLLAWEKMIRNNPFDHDMLGIPGKVQSSEHYIEMLKNTRAKILTTKGTYKYGQLLFFDNNVKARDVLESTHGFIIEKVEDLDRDQLKYRKVFVKGHEHLSQMDWWVFWDARWRFFDNKSFIEIRHIGTPPGIEYIEKIYVVFSRIFEEARNINRKAEELGIWKNINAARKMAIKNGDLPENHWKLKKFLVEKGVLNGI